MIPNILKDNIEMTLIVAIIGIIAVSLIFCDCTTLGLDQPMGVAPMPLKFLLPLVIGVILIIAISLWVVGRET